MRSMFLWSQAHGIRAEEEMPKQERRVNLYPLPDFAVEEESKNSCHQIQDEIDDYFQKNARTQNPARGRR